MRCIVLMLLVMLGLAGCASVAPKTYNASKGVETSAAVYAGTNETIAAAIRTVLSPEEAKGIDMYKALSKSVPLADLNQKGAFVELCRTKNPAGWYPIGGMGCFYSYVVNKDIRAELVKDDIVGNLISRSNHFKDNVTYTPGDVMRTFQLVARKGEQGEKECWKFGVAFSLEWVDCNEKISHALADQYFKQYPPTIQ